MERIKAILDSYDKEDFEAFKKTVDELFAKGVQKGCFQDYSILANIAQILSFCETYIKNK